MKIEASIPVKPYLLHYVYWKENIMPGTALDLSKPAGDIGFILGGLLTGKIDADIYGDDRDPPKAYSAKLEFLINPRRFNHKKIIISPDNIRFFNSYLHRNMHELLLRRILLNLSTGTPEVDTIYEFIAELDAEDLISFDAVKKANYRLREEKKIPHFRSRKGNQALSA